MRYICLSLQHKVRLAYLQNCSSLMLVYVRLGLEGVPESKRTNETFTHSVCSLVKPFRYKETHTSTVADQVAFGIL